MDYSIVWVRGHVEVYDWAGRFCFSADSEREAREELEGTAVSQGFSYIPRKNVLKYSYSVWF